MTAIPLLGSRPAPKEPFQENPRREARCFASLRYLVFALASWLLSSQTMAEMPGKAGSRPEESAPRVVLLDGDARRACQPLDTRAIALVSQGANAEKAPTSCGANGLVIEALSSESGPLSPAADLLIAPARPGEEGEGEAPAQELAHQLEQLFWYADSLGLEPWDEEIWRGLLVHSALEAESEGRGSLWGFVDIEKMTWMLEDLALSEATSSGLHRGSLEPGESATFRFERSSQAAPTLRVTLAWHDPRSGGDAATGGQDPSMQNQLDLSVVDPNGHEWLPWIRSRSAFAEDFRGVNLTDTHERVDIATEDEGSFEIIVSHSGGQGRQSFALWIAGPGLGSPPRGEGAELEQDSEDSRGNAEGKEKERSAKAFLSDEAPLSAYFSPSLESGQVSQFSGAAGYSLPLEMPSGPGALKLPLTLRYSSDLVSAKTGDKISDGGWLGIGWDLEIGKVEPGRLKLNGVSSELVYAENELYEDDEACQDDEAGWECVEKRVDRLNLAEAKYWKILKTSRKWKKKTCECVEGCLLGGSVDAQIKNDAKIEVWDTDGTQYEFGSTSYDAKPFNGWAGTNPSASSRAYYLSQTEGLPADYKEAVFGGFGLEKIIDAQGNTIEIDWLGYNSIRGWTHNCNDGGAGLPNYSFKEIYPTEIRYTTNPAASDHHAEWRVLFKTSRKEFDTLERHSLAYSGVKLESIQVWFHPLSGSPVLTREYVFDYELDRTEDKKSYRLAGIETYGRNGKEGYQAGQQNDLPTLEMDYQVRTVRSRSTNYHRYFMTHVDNGVGGGVGFMMEDWNWNGNEYRKQIATERTLDPGVGPAQVTTYEYSQPKIEHHDDGRRTLIGFGEVEESMAASGRVVKTEFHAQDNDPDHPLNGKQRLRTVSSSDGTKYSEDLWKWWPEKRFGEGDREAGWWVRMYEHQERMWDDFGDEHSRKVHHLFLPHLQGGEQFGLKTHTYYYDTATATAPYRRSRTVYANNLGRWIIGRPIEKGEYSGENWQWLRRTRLIWNDSPTPSYTQVADTGLLYAERRSIRLGGSEKMVDTRYAYDAHGNRTSTSTAGDYGQESAFGGGEICTGSVDYDTSYSTYPVVATNCEGHTTESYYYGISPLDSGGYGLPGQLQAERDANGHVSKAQQYDGRGRLRYTWKLGAELWDRTEASEIFHYSLADRWIRRALRDDEGAGGAHYRYDRTFFDALGRVVQTQKNWGNGRRQFVNHHYTVEGQTDWVSTPIIKVWSGDVFDAAGWSRTDVSRTTRSYDPSGRIRSETKPNGASRFFHYYGPWGEMTEVDEIGGRQSSQIYDTRGNPIQTIEWNGQSGSAMKVVITQRAYDVLGQLTSLTLADGQSLSFQHDDLGREIFRTGPDRGDLNRVYDARGREIERVNAMGEKVCSWFDNLGRMTARAFAYGGACPSAPPLIGSDFFFYDQGENGIGRRSSMRNDTVTIDYGYDGRGRTASETLVFGSGGRSYTSSFTYDHADRKRTMTYPDGTVAVTSYHGASGLPSSLLAGSHQIVLGTSYDAFGREASMSLGDGFDIAWGYGDAAKNHRLEELRSFWRPGDANRDFTLKYEWDLRGNLERLVDLAGPAGAPEEQRFDYDFMSRLTQARTVSSASPFHLSYGYDDLGNLKTVTNHLSGFADRWDYRGAHGKWKKNGGQKLWYDAAGRVIKRRSDLEPATYEHVYDAWNQLIRVEGPGGTERLQRDPDGHLVVIESPDSTRYFIGRHFEVSVPSTSTPAGGAKAAAGAPSSAGESAKKSYFFGGRVVAQEVEENGNADLLFLHPDHLGSVHLVTGSDGQVLRRSRSLPYGGERWSTGDRDVTDLAFNGERRHDDFGGLYQMGVRFYDSEHRTWMSPDLILPDVLRPESLNAYGYVSANPLRYTDPSGLDGGKTKEERKAERDGNKEGTISAVSWASQVAEVLHGQYGVDKAVGSSFWGKLAFAVSMIDNAWDAGSELIYNIDTIQELEESGQSARAMYHRYGTMAETAYDGGLMGAQIFSYWATGANPIGAATIELADEVGPWIGDRLGFETMDAGDSAFMAGSVVGAVSNPIPTGPGASHGCSTSRCVVYQEADDADLNPALRGALKSFAWMHQAYDELQNTEWTWP